MIQDFSCLEYINSSHQPKPTQFKDIKPELILRHTCNFRYRRYSGTGTCAPWVPVWWTKAVPVHISATPNGKVTWYRYLFSYIWLTNFSGTGTDSNTFLAKFSGTVTGTGTFFSWFSAVPRLTKFSGTGTGSGTFLPKFSGTGTGTTAGT